MIVQAYWNRTHMPSFSSLKWVLLVVFLLKDVIFFFKECSWSWSCCVCVHWSINIGNDCCVLCTF